MQPDWMDFYLFLSLLILFIYVLAVNKITTLHKAYLAFHSLMMLWPACNFFISTAGDSQFQWYFLCTAFVGLCFLGYGWLIFSLLLTRKIDGLKRLDLYLAAVPAVLCAILAATNPWHFMFARPYEGGWAVRIYGPFFWLFVAYSIIYLAAATVVILRTVNATGESNLKRQLILCLRGVILLLMFSLSDMLVNVVFFPRFGVVSGLTSLGIIFSALCFVVAIHKYDLFRIVTIAQQEVIDSMSTGMVVIDKDEIVLGLNKSAAGFLNTQPGRFFNVRDLFAHREGEELPGGFLEEYGADTLKSLQAEVMLREEQARHISVSVSPVMDGKKFLGRIVTLNDVTELRALLDKINESNAVLQRQNKELLRVQEELYEANRMLEHMAITDPLTGCFNKRYLLQQLVYEVSVARRYKISFSIMVLDIDRFKHFNDTHGHLAGDSALQGVVGVLKKNLRRSDILARFGGEEFIIYVPHTDREGAVAFAERIRFEVQNHIIPVSGKKLRVTVSIGLVNVDPGMEEISDPEIFMEGLLAQADMALYQAKAMGRNCVVAAGGGSTGAG